MKDIKQLFLLVIIIISTLGANGQAKQILPNSIEYSGNVWSSEKEIGLTGGGVQYEELHLSINYEYIAILSLPVKKIVAYYSTFIPKDLLNYKQSKKLAKALGGSSNLRKVQTKLLSDWKEEQKLKCMSSNGLYLYEKNGSLFASSSGKLDEFSIDNEGTIKHMTQPLIQISLPYNQDDYTIRKHAYWIYINGELKNKIQERRLDNFYLDPENIDSVMVDDHCQKLFIVQKNKNPDYFSLSDLNLEEVRNFYKIDIYTTEDISYMMIKKDGKIIDRYYPNRDIIEGNIIKSLYFEAIDDNLDSKVYYKMYINLK